MYKSKSNQSIASNAPLCEHNKDFFFQNSEKKLIERFFCSKDVFADKLYKVLQQYCNFKLLLNSI